MEPQTFEAERFVEKLQERLNVELRGRVGRSDFNTLDDGHIHATIAVEFTVVADDPGQPATCCWRCMGPDGTWIYKGDPACCDAIA